MAKLIRIAALALCMLMLLPMFAYPAMATATDLNDIVDEDQDQSSPTFADQLAQQDPQTGASEGAAPEGDEAPSFNALDAAGNANGLAADITKNSKYKATEGKMGVLVDAKLSTTWVNKKKAKIQITLSANDTAGYLYIEWVKKPSDYHIVEYDASGAELQSRDSTSYTTLVGVLPLLPETKKIEMVFGKKVGIATMRVYSQGVLPTAVQEWQAPLEKADLMVVSAHQDDEFLYFGGTIPYYNTVLGKDVQVVYMANCGRPRYAEALNGLWSVGMRNAPDFVGFPDKYSKTLKDAKKHWKLASVVEQLVARIRKYKPDVIVSHDPKGEYGHGAHMLTAEALKLAVEQAADDTKFKSSANAYGVWQVQKLYLHLYTENQITMDWKQPADELDGNTPSEAARQGYLAHKSQQKSFTYEEGGKYDNAQFGLAFTTVGPDEDKDDFFENINAGAAKLNLEDSDGDAQTDLPVDEDGLPSDEYFVGDETEEPTATEPATAPEADGTDAIDPFAGEEEDESVTPPVEPGTPADTRGLLAIVIGAPVLLGGSAFGVNYARKRAKKPRKASKPTDV